jgi:GxxExxY protein
MNELTERIIGCAFKVGNVLGAGFLEKVYENALAYELRKSQLIVKQQSEIKVHYDGIIVGDYHADLYVNDCVIVELKALKALDPSHQAQCLNYLRATNLQVCLLINFGSPKLEIKRIVHNYTGLLPPPRFRCPDLDVQI